MSEIIKLLDNIVQAALTKRASDIHIENAPEAIQVRFRIDGLLLPETTLDKESGIQLQSRIKVLAELDIAERRLPQDGKFEFDHNTVPYDMRVSTFPTIHGEKIVIRLLNRSLSAPTLSELGLETEVHDQLVRLARSSQGFIIVTGPTGSGKTTTLHALVSSIKNSSKNIVTLEDPVEYTISGVNQTQVHADIGLTFEIGLRSLLRADPDIIMVGEIRDRETAQVALQASLTGHLVMSTLHTNDAPSALLRLRDMGLQPFLINAGITAILAQRLVRKLCSVCKYQRKPTTQERNTLTSLNVELDELWVSMGCEHCAYTGYFGRTGIFQLLRMNYALGHLLMNDADYDVLKNQACADGMRNLVDDAKNNLRTGVTSLDEIIRVLY